MLIRTVPGSLFKSLTCLINHAKKIQTEWAVSIHHLLVGVGQAAKLFPQDVSPSSQEDGMAQTFRSYFLFLYTLSPPSLIKTKDDVEHFFDWVYRPQNINGLTLDAGQAYVVRAFTQISSASTSASTSVPQQPAVPSTSSTADSALTQETATMLPTESEPAIFMALAVNQKAVHQPIFRFRRVAQVPENSNTIWR